MSTDDAATSAKRAVLRIEGPRALVASSGLPTVFRDFPAGVSGIYLWCVPFADRHVVLYVGESSRCVQKRIAEHHRLHCSGAYSLFDPVALARGAAVEIWPGEYGASGRSIGECVEASVRFSVEIAQLARMARFFVVQTDCDNRMRKRIEAALSKAIRAAPGFEGSLQARSVRYARRRSDETPVEFSIESSGAIFGLPSVLTA
jgi:hypothetical protein